MEGVKIGELLTAVGSLLAFETDHPLQASVLHGWRVSHQDPHRASGMKRERDRQPLALLLQLALAIAVEVVPPQRSTMI